MANKDQPIGEWSVGWLRRVLLYTRSNLSPVVVVPPFKEWDGRMCAEEGRNKYVFPSPIRCVVRAACIYVLHTPNRIAGGSGGMDEAMQLGFAFLLSFFSLPSTTTVISSSPLLFQLLLLLLLHGGLKENEKNIRALRFLDLH